MDMIIFMLVMATSAGCVIGDSITCWSYGSFPHCTTQGLTFHANIPYRGRTNTPNSDCATHFLIKVSPLSGSKWRSYKCSMWMNVPEYNRDLYSFSHDASANGVTGQSPYIYGYGRAASVKGKTNRFSFDESWFWPSAHNTDKHYSHVSYWFGKNKIIAVNSDQQVTRFASNKMFDPASRWTYIGINRLYATRDGVRGAGSGVCRFHCYTSESDGNGPMADMNPEDAVLTGKSYESGQHSYDEYL